MKQLFGVTGILACIFLVIMDFNTSYAGAKAMLLGEPKGMIAYMPFVMATLALSLNALSAQMFRHCQEEDYTDTSKMYLVGLWIVFLLFDGVTSWVGFMMESTATSTFSAMTDRFGEMSATQQIFSVLFPVLMVTSPFLLTVFWNLCSEVREEFQAMMGDSREVR